MKNKPLDKKIKVLKEIYKRYNEIRDRVYKKIETEKDQEKIDLIHYIFKGE